MPNREWFPLCEHLYGDLSGQLYTRRTLDSGWDGLFPNDIATRSNRRRDEATYSVSGVGVTTLEAQAVYHDQDDDGFTQIGYRLLAMTA